MDGESTEERHRSKRARTDDATVRRVRRQWDAVSAVCRQRRRLQTQESLHTVWDALSDEAVWCVLVVCAQRDICALAGTCHRMHRLCTDDALWRHIYRRDFPPCRGACLLTLGDEVSRSPLSPLDHAQRRLDRLLSQDGDLSAPDPLEVCMWTVDRLTTGAICDDVSHCVHHWPDVISARGHRWACASMVPLASRSAPQRRFYPVGATDAQGTIVGCCKARSASLYDRECDNDEEDPYESEYAAPYRGEVEIRNSRFIAHGMGTVSGNHKSRGLPWVCRSGAWSHGRDHLQGPCASWQRAVGQPETVVFVHSSGRDVLRHGDTRCDSVCGVGVLLSSDGAVAVGCLCHYDGDPQKGSTRLALIAHGADRAEPCTGSVTAMTTGASLRRVANYLSGARRSKSIDGTGLLRTPSQRVAFVGSFAKGEPHIGKTWDVDGRLLYAGSFKYNALDHGTLYATDGRTLRGSWVRGWRDVDSPAYRIPATHVTVSHPDGATVLWNNWMRVDGRTRPRVADFWWTSTPGDTTGVERPWPSADWDVFVLQPDRTQRTRAPARPLLAEAGLGVARSTHLLHADEITDDLAFWPRPNPDDGPRPHLDDTLAFLARMVPTRPRWVRCPSIVRAMYAPL
ncbi:F-box incomplete domain containing protein [Pandoravirus salinus]|uniref:F-box incomplete domain containing protein n=1 Tax=Pandoravirus salinus TaxID=1349410 RepID=S4W421_9VIRU|nr:F-box incomplete domain [Pandoravirus salinus]AGO85055.1 F-box incomplete domain containing protein [Pandoravirus salinus]